jgi:hypothetical protein
MKQDSVKAFTSPALLFVAGPLDQQLCAFLQTCGAK